MKYPLLFLIIWLAPKTEYSQITSHNADQQDVEKVTFNHSFFSFSIAPYLVNKAKATQISGSYSINTRYLTGLEGVANYHSNFSNKYSLLVGLHVGASAKNFELAIQKSDFKPNLKFDVEENGALTRMYDFYISAPIWFEKRWFTKKHSHWNFFGGINLRYYPVKELFVGFSSFYADINNKNVDVFDLTYTVGNNLAPWVDYNLGGGYSLLLSNHNFLRCNLLINLSNKKLINGTYQINVSGKPQSTGNYSANLSYIGLSFSYIFTGANKRLRKMYEKKMEINH